jgi:hypothetical protein
LFPFDFLTLGLGSIRAERRKRCDTREVSGMKLWVGVTDKDWLSQVSQLRPDKVKRLAGERLPCFPNA